MLSLTYINNRSDKMSRRIRENRDFLTVLSKSSPKLSKSILSHCDDDVIKAICELCHNVLSGNIAAATKHRHRLAPYKNSLRQLGGCCYRSRQSGKFRVRAKEARKVLLNQRGGILPAFLLPLLGLAGKAILGGVASTAAGYGAKKLIDKVSGS